MFEHQSQFREQGIPQFNGLIFPTTTPRSTARRCLLKTLHRVFGARLVYLARFVLYHRRLPRFWSPKRMTDKLALRILTGRCSSFRRDLADKLTCREIVGQICPQLRIKQIYAVYESAEEFSLAELPGSFVLKLNNASGLNLVVLDKAAASEQELRRTIAAWLRLNYYELTQEPCYRGIKSKVFAEELLLSREQTYPLEFRIFCFHGKAACIDYEVVPNVAGYSVLVDRDWNPMPFQYAYGQLDPATIPRPERLQEAIRTAEELSAGLDFIRVDLYDLPDGLAFGEMTNLPWGGLVRLGPAGADEALGSYWKPYSALADDHHSVLNLHRQAAATNLVARTE